jgi:hypothetical protein
MPPGCWPHIASVMAGLVLPFSQRENRPFSQNQNLPQAITEQTTTRSPTEWFCTPEPTSTTSPRNSWPMTSPARIVGM